MSHMQLFTHAKIIQIMNIQIISVLLYICTVCRSNHLIPASLRKNKEIDIHAYIAKDLTNVISSVMVTILETVRFPYFTASAETQPYSFI